MSGVFDILAGPGEARATARKVDWSSSVLGSPDAWPFSLRTALSIVFNSRHPMFLWWGPELVQFYNDAYLPSFGRGKHPAAMGQRGVDCWQEIWPIIQPQIEDVMLRAKASWNEDQLVPIFRNERIEEVYWTYGYSPVLDESGAVGGVLVVCTETTQGVLAVRRLEFIRKLATALNDAQDAADVVRIAAACLRLAPLDIPYFSIAVDGTPPLFGGLASIDNPELLASSNALVPPSLKHPVACTAWPEPVTESVAYAFEGLSGGTLSIGISPRLPFDEAYRSFLAQVVEQIASAQARNAIELERRRLLIQAPVAAALLIGPQHVFEIANPRYVEMVGRDVQGKRYMEAFPELKGSALSGILDGVYQRGEPFVTHEMLIPLTSKQSGQIEDHFFNFSLEPIRDVRGNVYGMMAVAVDISAQVLARSSLQRDHEERAALLEAAQVASRAKDEFLAMLGHELRNPLAPILTALELMKQKQVSGIERERQIIERQASHLINLVDDLLDVSRVVQGKITLNRKRVALATVVDLALETAMPLIEQRRHKITLDVAVEGLDVDADRGRLSQVVANLLTNAARYTNPGGAIAIRARREGEFAVLRVEDNGIGISSEQLERIFERFFQGSRTAHRAQGGLGLGLALVKSLTELHGGTVRVESAGPGQGSAFELRIPLHVAKDQEVEPAPLKSSPHSVANERVLLVDDNEDIVDLFGAILEQEGYEVRTANDGPGALLLAASYRPTVAVLDLGLPGMDGYEIAAHLREQLTHAVPRLIAMSGYGQRDDIERTRAAGFEHHLVKPVDAAKLLSAIRGKA